MSSNKKPSLTEDALRNSNILVETGRPDLALELIKKYNRTDLLQRKLSEIVDLKKTLKETTEAFNLANISFLKEVKKRRKLITEKDLQK